MYHPPFSSPLSSSFSPWCSFINWVHFRPLFSASLTSTTTTPLSEYVNRKRKLTSKWRWRKKIWKNYLLVDAQFFFSFILHILEDESNFFIYCVKIKFKWLVLNLVCELKMRVNLSVIPLRVIFDFLGLLSCCLSVVKGLKTRRRKIKTNL